MTNTDIFLGSGASLTFVPEIDQCLTLLTSGTTTTLLKLGTSVTNEILLVPNLYVGCILDLYDADVSNTVPKSTHTITANTANDISITPAHAISSIANNTDFVIIRGYGAPCAGPKNSSTARLNADNWLGLLESAEFPNVEVEVKQMNLSLGGSRNMTYQYKGIETASGGNLNVVANHGAWLYYALGQCTKIKCELENVTLGDSFIGNTQGHIYINDGSNSTYGSETGEMESHTNTGPIFYKTSSVTGGSNNKTLMPFVLQGVDTSGGLERLVRTTSTATATDKAITYTFAETDNSELPSFSLEQTLSKLPSSNKYVTNHTGSADQLEDLNFIRVARGNRVNTFTMTANENEEVKMTMDLMTRTVHKLGQDDNYEARGGQETNTSLLNFSSTTDAELLEPFFFSRGSFSIFGQQFLKITNLSLTINNNLQEKRFVGVGSTSIQDAIPANRMYELSFTALVTDDLLFQELFNRTENTGDGVVTSGSDVATAGLIDLQFDKANGEEINISFKNYFLESANFTIPDDKGPITVEAMVKPRDLKLCTVKTHWVLQG